MRMVGSWRQARVGGSMEVRSWHWRAQAVRAYVVRADRLAFDGRVAPRGWLDSPPRRRHSLTVPLAGEYVSFRGPETVVAPRVGIVEPSTGWGERWEPGLQALIVEWSSEVGGPASGTLRLSRPDHVHAQSLASAIEGPLPPEPWLLVAPFWSRLRALGLPLAPPQDIALPEVPPIVVRLEAALSEHLARLDCSPSASELAATMAMSERHLRRCFEAHVGWLGSFRSRLRHGRLPAAASALALSELSAEQVGRSLGYGSGTALVRALTDAGFGDREEMRARVR